MGTIIQLNDRIEVDTPIGRGFAILFETNTEDNYWTIVIKESGAIVTYKQKYIRVVNNYSEEVGNITHEMMKDITKRGK